MSAMSIILPLAVLLLAIGWGFFIGMRRTRARFFVVLACLILAIIATAVLKSTTYADIAAAADSAIAQSGSEKLQDLWAMVEDSKAMQEIAVSGGAALAAPFIFAATFVGLSVVSWIICYIVFIIAAIVRAASGRHRRRARPVRTIVYAALQWVITLFVLLTPAACYLSGMTDMVDIAVDLDLLDKIKVTEADARQAAENAENNPLLKVYNALGGKKIASAMTAFKVNGKKTDINRELTSLTKFGASLLRLSRSEIKNYGTDEADLMQNLSDSFGDSLLLPTLGGEVIWYATDAWESGDTFLGVAKPDLGKDENTRMFAEAFDHILETFQADARVTDNLREDFATIADLVEIMANDGVFSAMQETGTDALIEKLSGGTTVADMIGVLHANSRFSVLVTDITNIGMRFIAEALQLPENAEEIYKNFTTEIADAVNEIKASGKTSEELAADLRTALDNSGVEFTTDTSVLELYATALLEDLEDQETVTPEDIENFFRAFETAENENVSARAEGGVTYLSEKKQTAGDAFVMVSITRQFLSYLQALSAQELTQEAFTAQAKAEMDRLLNATEKYRTGSKAEALRASLMKIIDEMKPDAVTEDLVSRAAMLGKPDTLPTYLVTAEDLLAQANGDRDLTDAQKQQDANAIQNVFSKAASIKNALEGGSDEGGLGSVSGAVGDLGKVLDDLTGLSSVGEEKTDKLATAIMQSEAVRKSTGLTPKEAAELVNKMTERGEDGEKPKFEDTFASLSDGADIIAKLKNNEAVSEEEIHRLLENMTPQTAGALELLVNEDRMGSFGVSEESRQEVAAELVRNLLHEMGDRKTYAGTYAEETRGVTKLFDVAMAASKQNGKSHLFRRGDSDEDSVLGTADEVVSAILDSEMVCRAIDNTVKQGTDPELVNPFGLKSADKDSDDYRACKAAIERYAAAHPDLNENYLKSICALFGVELEK